MSEFQQQAHDESKAGSPSEVVSIRDQIVSRIAQKQRPFVSIEFFPPKTEAGIISLFEVLEKLKGLEPLFCDVTWGAGGSTSDLTVQLCKQISERGVVPNMHLTCTNTDRSKIDGALDSCKAAGIKNILALRGDPPAGEAAWVAQDASLSCALDLVTYIRQRADGDYFSLAVAGYPEGHPSKMSLVEDTSSLSEAELLRCSTDVDEAGKSLTYVCRDADYAAELGYLKRKVDAGASLIVTQMFFDCEVFITFVRDCRAAGILCPILPGIMCISAFGGFVRMAKFCKSRVPLALASGLEAIKDDEAAVREFGIQYGEEMCRSLVQAGACGLHFYTLNSSVVTRAIVERIRDIVDVPALAFAPTPVPSE